MPHFCKRNICNSHGREVQLLNFQLGTKQTKKYRVFHDLCTLLQKVIYEVFVIRKVHIHICPILDGYGVMTA